MLNHSLASLDILGRPMISDAARRRREYAERDLLIAALGMAPEDRSSAGSRYAATTGELAFWVHQSGKEAA